MIISQIDFFITCAKALMQTHQAGSPTQKRQVETFLKTWLFYNSSSAEIFWTGKTSQQVINGEAAVAEHWYGNLSSAYYIMNPDVLDEDFFGLTKPNQVLKIFKFMQWNKTSKAENTQLRELQKPQVFFGEYQGNPDHIYEAVGVALQNRGNNLLPDLDSFFDYSNLKPNNANSSIFEIGLTPKKRLDSFLSRLTEASENIGVNLKCVRISNKGCLYRIHPTIELPGQNSFANFYRITMTALWRLFRNQNEIQNFLDRYGYSIAENGPYRSANTFDQNYGNYSFSIRLPNGARYPRTLWLWTRYNDECRYLQLMELFDFFDATLNVYDYNLELRNLGQQIAE
jgi:hypothetical protein